MTAARTGVLNEALTHLGQPLRVGTDDSSTWVVKLGNLYGARAKLMLESYPWNFAAEIELLSASDPTPLDWEYGFNKPANCLRVLKVDSQANMRRRRSIDHEVRGGRILTNSETTYCKFVSGAYINLEGAWPQHPQSALAWDLAELVGPSMDLSQGKLDRIALKAARAISKAKLWDAQQNPTERPGLSRWQSYRLSSRGQYKHDTGGTA